MGGMPSHPELLDWLASRFRRIGRLAQVAAPPDRHERRLPAKRAARRPSFAAIDGDNQWLWRQNRRRLDAESVHDAILAVAGQLDPTMGGPSVQQFSLRPGVHVTPVVDYSQYDWASPGSYRRSVYRFLFRTLPDPFFDALDSADASQLTAVRTESTTPLAGPRALEQPVCSPPVRSVCQTPCAEHGEPHRRAGAAGHRAGLRPRGTARTKSSCSRPTPRGTAWRTLCRMHLQ